MVESASRNRSQISRVPGSPRGTARLAAICVIASVLVAGAVVARAPSARIAHDRGASQEQPAGAPGTAQGPAIRSESDVVHLDVLVTDQDGRVLKALKKENFRVLDNGQPQAVTNFAPTSAPITMVILMEYSGTAYNYFAYKAASWGSVFVNYLEPRDWIALVTYDLKPSIRVDFTRNKASIRDSLATLSFPQFRETNLFDSLLDTLDRLEEVKGKKSLLLIGTGANTFSANSLGSVIDRIQRTDVTISVSVSRRANTSEPIEAASPIFRPKISWILLQTRRAVSRISPDSRGNFPTSSAASPAFFGANIPSGLRPPTWPRMADTTSSKWKSWGRTGSRCR